MLVFQKRYSLSPTILVACALFLAGCEVGKTSSPKSPYRAPSGGNSSASPGVTRIEVATTFSVSVTVKDKSGFGIPNVVPTITASKAGTGSTGVTIGGCSATDRKGLTSCTLSANLPGTYTIAVTRPVAITAVGTVLVEAFPRSLEFTTQPVGAVSRAAITQPVIKVKDKAGNTLTTNTDTVTLTLVPSTTAGSSAFFAGDNDEVVGTGAAGAGFADFTGNALSVALVDSYTMRAALVNADVGTITATSSSFSITAGTADTLKWKVQPSTTAATDNAFAIQPIIVQVDASGNEVTTGGTTDSCVVTLSINTATSSEQSGDQLLGSSLSMTMADGVANFATPSKSLRIRRDGSGAAELAYFLKAVADATCLLNDSNVDSTQITVNLAKQPRRLAIVQPPSTAALNETWVNQPAVSVLDINGDIVATDSTTRVIMGQPTAVGGGQVGQLVGSTTIQVSAGLATFSALKIFSTDENDGAKTYQYAFTGVNPPFTITGVSTTQFVSQNGFTPDRLQFRVQPTSVAVDEQMPTIEVKTVDDQGFFCFNDNASRVQLMYRATDTLSDGAMRQGSGSTPLGQEDCNGVDDAGVDTLCDVTHATNTGRVINGIATFAGIKFNTSGAKRILAMDALDGGAVSGPAELPTACVDGNTRLCSALSDVIAINDHATLADHLTFELKGNPTNTCDAADSDSACQPADPQAADGTDGGAGAPWMNQPRVAVVDKFNNVMTSDNTTKVTIDCMHVEPCDIAGTLTVTVTGGTAIFNDLRVGTGTAKANIVLKAVPDPPLPATTAASPATSRAFTEND